jgi:hypothetical protein
LLEVFKYYGRDINLVEAFDLYKTVQRKYLQDVAQNLRPMPSGKDTTLLTYKEPELRRMFLRALSELKYMGIVSATKQSTFIFKKNVYGKPKQFAAHYEGNN